MNYRHGYHAGNFADVFKHTILIALINALSRKETPFCYLETHAGRGLYDLSSEFSQKTQEYTTGVARLMSNGVSSTNKLSHPLPPIVKQYQKIVTEFQYPRYYPGSPAIVKNLLRKNDRMILMEYHPEEFKYLQNIFRNDRQINLHHQDGYLGLKAFLPPKERRGLVLIDPPFEAASEWDSLKKVLKIGMQKFSHGIYAIWYPLKNQSTVNKFLDSLTTLGPEVLISELTIYPTDAQFNLTGCGLAIVNPPWQLEDELRPLVSLLWETFSVKGAGHFSVRTELSP